MHPRLGTLYRQLCACLAMVLVSKADVAQAQPDPDEPVRVTLAEVSGKIGASRHLGGVLSEVTFRDRRVRMQFRLDSYHAPSMTFDQIDDAWRTTLRLTCSWGFERVANIGIAWEVEYVTRDSRPVYALRYGGCAVAPAEKPGSKVRIYPQNDSQRSSISARLSLGRRSARCEDWADDGQACYGIEDGMAFTFAPRDER